MFMSAVQPFGYALEHATGPATLGLVVGCNPMSLLCWYVTMGAIESLSAEKLPEPSDLPTPAVSGKRLTRVSPFSEEISRYCIELE